MGDSTDDELRTDVYQDHPTPDTTEPQLRRIDSAVDVGLAAWQLAEDSRDVM